MSRMHNNMWVFFIPIMKIEYTIPGKTSLLEFVLFIKFINEGRQDLYYIYMIFFHYF